MKLYELKKASQRTKKRVGRGLGSGKGKTAGRGTKGQKAREKVPVGFIGGTLPIYKTLPYRRGIGNPKRAVKAITLSLGKLATFKAKDIVSVETLIERGLVKEKDAKKYGVKIMGEGKAPQGLIVKLPTTLPARGKIEKSGGKVLDA